MPNPFNKSTGAIVASIEVTDSELYCEVCGQVTDHGIYTPESRRLVFECPQGHENVVRGIEIE